MEIDPFDFWRGSRIIHDWKQHLRYCEAQSPRGMVLEFGVRYGQSTRVLAESGREVVGFDSFDGLPEDWDKGNRVVQAGEGATEPPELPGNVSLVRGLFADTLPGWLNGQKIGMVHFDADLYQSTLTALELLKPLLFPGCVLAFDELYPFNGEDQYPNWAEHEWRALLDSDLQYAPLARTGDEQASVIVL